MSSDNNNTSVTKKKVPANKGKKTHTGGKKPFYSSSQGGPKRNNDQAKKKKISKTLFIGQIYMGDIERSEVSTQLIEHRVSYLKSVLEKYGEVENFQNNIESNNYVLVTYKTRETAERVLNKLRSKGEMESLMEQIKVQLAKNKIPPGVCPNLTRYKYDWSDKPARVAKNAYSVKKVSYQKEEETTPKDTNKEVEVNGKKNEVKKKKEKKPKKKYQKKSEVETTEEVNQKDVPEEKSEKVEEKFNEKRVLVSEDLRRDAEDLRREADKAKLKDELEYLSKQLENVEAEINAENKRCKDRDLRISKLEEELRRVDDAKSRLERQLGNERRWKKLNQDTVSQLTRELDHIRQEQQSANLRLTHSEDLEQAQTNEGPYF